MNHNLQSLLLFSSQLMWIAKPCTYSGEASLWIRIAWFCNLYLFLVINPLSLPPQSQLGLNFIIIPFIFLCPYQPILTSLIGHYSTHWQIRLQILLSHIWNLREIWISARIEDVGLGARFRSSGAVHTVNSWLVDSDSWERPIGRVWQFSD